MSTHIQVLEQADLVTRTRDAQRRPVHLNPRALESLTAWIDTYRLIAEAQYRRLDAVLETMKSAPPASVTATTPNTNKEKK